MENNAKNVMTFFIILLLGIVSIGCLDPVSAQSAVYVITTSEGGEFDFTGNGAEWDWYMDITGYDIANVDLTNHWIYSTDTVIYNDVGDGEIHIKVSNRNYQDEWMYYDWGIVQYNGNGLHVPKLLGGGGRSVNVTDSPNVTTYIEQVVEIRKAVFLMDTRHTSADLTVVVHNGHLLENASVELIGGPRAVQWTDENGEVKFSVSTGKYAMIIEAEGFNAMLVDDLVFESQNMYRISVNMTDCLTSSGSAFCAPDSDDLIMFYKEKEPNMGDISPQSFVNYFANRLTTCMAGRDHAAIGSLERMATLWDVYPDPALGVLLYSCNFTELRCDTNWCEYEITYEVRNFQDKPYDYTVSLIADDTTTELNSGTLNATFSETGRDTITKTVVVNCDNNVSSCGGQMYLAVVSEQVDD
jgi:hypothetical protein